MSRKSPIKPMTRAQEEVLSRWSPSLHKQTPGQFREAVKTMVFGRTDPTNILNQLPRELLLSIIEEYAKSSVSGYSSYDQALKHPMPGGLQPTNCFVAIGSQAAAVRDTDWRGFCQLTLADDDALYVKFLDQPCSGWNGSNSNISERGNVTDQLVG